MSCRPTCGRTAQGATPSDLAPGQSPRLRPAEGRAVEALGSADDRFHEECAVVGIHGHAEAGNLAYLGLYSMQHRGQEGSGIVSSNGEALISHRGLGLVADVFPEAVIRRLVGDAEMVARIHGAHEPVRDESHHEARA